MWVDFRPRGQWTDFNDLVTKTLGLSLSKVELATFPNIHVALTETVILLAKAFPFKKKCFFIKGVSPLLEPSLLWLSKEGYQITGLDPQVAASPDFAAPFDRDTLFVLWSEDDPLLGRKFVSRALEESARAKGVIHLSVSHSAHARESLPQVLDRNAVKLYSFGNIAIKISGERTRTGAVATDQLVPPYSAETEVTEAYPNLFFMIKPVPDAIKSFEQRTVAGAKPLLGENAERVWDRAVIYWKDMDGHAVIDRLAKKLEFQLQPPGMDPRLETMSLSRWGGVRTFDFYRELGYDAETLRGTVILAHSLLDSRLEQLLIEIRQSILKDQTG